MVWGLGVGMTIFVWGGDMGWGRRAGYGCGRVGVAVRYNSRVT